MDDNQNAPVTEDGAKQPDLAIENSALKELLAENNNTMKSLREELTEVKKVNAKLLAQINVQPKQQSCEEAIYELMKGK